MTGACNSLVSGARRASAARHSSSSARASGVEEEAVYGRACARALRCLRCRGVNARFKGAQPAIRAMLKARLLGRAFGNLKNFSVPKNYFFLAAALDLAG